MRDVELKWLRRQIITALAADDDLFELLILKGGNALALVHEIGLRASVDIDYSMEEDAEDPSKLGQKIFRALRERLKTFGLRVFDESFLPRPRNPRSSNEWWGGYNAEFKLVSEELWAKLNGDIEKLRRQSLPVRHGMQSERKFRIEISKFEFCKEREEKLVEDGFSCQVYTPGLIAAEKLRSICQQMKEYKHRVHATPRARDFYDLHALLTEGRVELSEGNVHEMIRAVFKKKQVPLTLLARVELYRDFHEADWPRVSNAIPSGRIQDYGFYFDFVVAEIRKLEPAWIKNAP